MALIGTIVENWNSGTFDTAKWNVWGGAKITIDAGRLRITHETTATYYGIETLDAHDWTSGHASIKIVELPNLDNVNDPEYSITIGAEINSDNRYYIGYEGTNKLVCYKVVAGAYNWQGEVVYDAAVHKYLRIRFSTTHCFWEYSTDGTAWVQIATQDITSVAITALRLNIGNGAWAPVATVQYALFDDINIVPRQLAPTSIAEQLAFGTHTVSNVSTVQNISPASIAEQLAFGTHALSAGAIAAQTINPAGIGDQVFVSTNLTIRDPATTPKVHTASDDFNNGISAIWDNWGGATTNAEGQLVITKPAGGSYFGMITLGLYDATNSQATMQLVDAGDQANPTFEATPVLLEDAAAENKMYITVQENKINAQIYTGGQYYLQANVAYDRNLHKWFRLREASGTVYYEYGQDGLNWTQLAAVAKPAAFDMSSVKMSVLIGDYDPNATKPASTALIDNFNPVIDTNQTATMPSIESQASVGEPQLVDPALGYIFATGIAEATNMGTPTLKPQLIIKPPSNTGASVVGMPAINGTLAPNDTAPSYEFYRRSFLPLRDIKAGVYISFVRGYDADAAFYTVGTSAFDSGDVWQGDGSTIQEWDKFDYDDYSEYLSGIQYHQEQDRLGSMVMGYADFSLHNFDNMFSPYGDSPIAPLILPNRPVKLYAGFGSNQMQVFVGQTMRLPEATRESAKFHAKDFIASFAETEITAGKIYVGQRTDQIIDDILQNTVGLSPVQYTLDVGLNTISFLHVEPGTKVGDLLRKLCEAEQGRFYQDANGRLHFNNAPNLITNPSFDTDLTGWTNYNQSTLTRDAANYYSAPASMKIVTSGVGTDSALQGAYDPLSATVGATYRAGAWVKGTASDTMRFYSSGVIDANGGEQDTSTDYTLTGQWQHIHHQFTARTTTPFVYIMIENANTAVRTMYIDNVTVSPVGHATALKLIPEMVLREKDPQAANVINRVKINADVRTIQPEQQVYPGLKDGSTSTYDDFDAIEVPANSSVEKFFDMKDPVTTYVMPSADYLVNSASDGSGTNVTAGTNYEVLATFTDSIKVRFTNTTATTSYVIKFTVRGTPAKITKQIRIDVSDDVSIDKYGEKLHEIKNHAFTSEPFAASVANGIVGNNAEAPFTREVELRGIPYMQVGDVITYRDNAKYVVDMISGRISASDGNRQEVRLRKV